jgi:hypothetical protein
MIPADPATREQWDIYEQMNRTANAAYAAEVADHGPYTLPHPCHRPQCSAANRTYRRFRNAKEAA